MMKKKTILEQYVDACKLVEETEEDIRRLKKKQKTIIQTNVSGSNPEFPYQERHFKVQGTTFTYRDDRQLRMEEKLLEERKTNAQAIKEQAEEYVNLAPPRIQRIIRFKIFQEMSWEQAAQKMGGKATGDSIRMELERYMKER